MKKKDEINFNNDSNNESIKEKIIKKKLTKEDYNKLNNLLDARIEKEKYQTKYSITRLYIIFITALFLVISISIGIWFLPIETFLKMFCMFFTIPVFLILIFVIMVRQILFDDFGVLRGNIIIKVRTDYIIANIFLTQRRIIKRICLLNNDGITFNYAGGIYIVDFKNVYFDDNNCPNSFYIINVPNSLELDFETYFRKSFNALIEKDKELNTSSMDILYSSENLSVMKKNDYVKKLHKDNTKEISTIILYAAILIGLAFVTIIIVVLVLNNKQVNVTIAQNTSELVKAAANQYRQI